MIVKPKQFGTDDALVSRREVASRIGCNPKTVQRAERRGELKAVKFNSRFVRYRRSDIEAWIANSIVMPAGLALVRMDEKNPKKKISNAH